MIPINQNSKIVSNKLIFNSKNVRVYLYRFAIIEEHYWRKKNTNQGQLAPHEQGGLLIAQKKTKNGWDAIKHKKNHASK